MIVATRKALQVTLQIESNLIIYRKLTLSTFLLVFKLLARSNISYVELMEGEPWSSAYIGGSEIEIIERPCSTFILRTALSHAW